MNLEEEIHIKRRWFYFIIMTHWSSLLVMNVLERIYSFLRAQTYIENQKCYLVLNGYLIAFLPLNMCRSAS